jgi:hypothetical protein
MLTLSVVLGISTLLPDGSGTVDLSRLRDRPIKEPTYGSNVQKYCLLVFGPRAEKPIWIVVDGTTLFVDANGNGDLTEPLEAVAGDGRWYMVPHVVLLEKLVVSIGVNLNLENDVVWISGKDRPHDRSMIRQAAVDTRGRLRFAPRRADAPVIWFDGPLQMSLRVVETLHRNETRPWFSAMIGTPGVGPGTFAAINHFLVPDDVHPIAEVLPSGDTSDVHGAVQRFTLKDRC